MENRAENFEQCVARLTGERVVDGLFPEKLWQLNNCQLAELVEKYEFYTVGCAFVCTERFYNNPREAALELFNRLSEEKAFILAVPYLLNCLAIAERTWAKKYMQSDEFLCCRQVDHAGKVSMGNH